MREELVSLTVLPAAFMSWTGCLQSAGCRKRERPGCPGRWIDCRPEPEARDPFLLFNSRSLAPIRDDNAAYFICDATKSQFTRFQNASTYFGRALR
jgi:hypothetical protein